MALQLRRGTDAERSAVTFADGELVYTTDTKKLYVGDGATAGGNSASADTLDSLTDTNLTGSTNNDVLTYNASTSKWESVSVPGLGRIALTDLTDVYPGPFYTGEILQFNGVQFAPTSINQIINPGSSLNLNLIADDSTIMVNATTSTFTGDLTGSVFGDDSSIIVNGLSNTLHGDLTGNVTGNAFGAHTGTLDGDLTGSVFGGDSSVIVDGNNNSINTSSITSSDNVITVTGPITSSDVSFVVTGSGTNPGEIHLGRNGTGDLSADTIPNGRLTFNRTDTVNAGTITTSFIIGNNDRLSFFHNTTGNTSNLPSYVVMKDSKFGIGTLTPTTTLDVAGEGRFTGFVQFGSLTTVQRNALTAANGMVIYNSTDNKFQGYENSAWVNLV